MRRQDITEAYDKDHIGLAHLAFHADTKERVDQMIERFRADGYTIAGETCVSGDGYYEGVIRDPDGNIVEIVANGEPEIQAALFPPYELLLEADPDREKVEAYLKGSDCFIATVRNSVAGVIVVKRKGGSWLNTKMEILNLTVAEGYRRRGIARKLLRYVQDVWCPEHGVDKIYVSTGNTSTAALRLYLGEGFHITAFTRHYFTQNYPEPIMENGIRCKHRVILEKRLG